MKRSQLQNMTHTAKMTATKIKRASMLTFALIYLTYGVQASFSSERIATWQRIDDNKQLVFTGESINGQHLVYAICKDYANLWCNVSLELLTSNHSRSCSLSLQNRGSLEEARLIPMSADRIIIVGTVQEMVNDEETVFVRFATLTMDDCKIVEHKRFNDYSISQYSVTPLDEKRYDIVAMYEAESFCRWEVDSEKKNVSGPFDCLLGDITKHSTYKRPIIYFWPGKGYILTNGENQHWIKIDNKQILAKIRPELNDNEVVTSTANNKISICSTENSTTTTCWQYDGSGQLVNNVVIVHDLKFKAGSAVYNLKSGGFIVAVGLCEEGCNDLNLVPTYYVSTYNERGMRMRMTIIRNFICNLNRFDSNYKVALKFYENEKGKLCLAMACYGISSTREPFRYKPKLNVNTECFD